MPGGMSGHRGGNKEPAGDAGMGSGQEGTGCFQPHYPEREIPQNCRGFLNATGRNKLTSFGQYCALWQESPAILGISPPRIEQLETACPLPPAPHSRIPRRFSAPSPVPATTLKDISTGQ